MNELLKARFWIAVFLMGIGTTLILMHVSTEFGAALIVAAAGGYGFLLTKGK